MKKLFIIMALAIFCLNVCAQSTGHTSAEPANRFLAVGVDYLMKGDLTAAFEAFKKGADLGSSDCQYQVALCYDNGEGTAVDYQQAFTYLYKAATANNIYSYKELGLHYMLGKGVTKNYGEAIKWFAKGARQSRRDDLSLAPDCMHYIGVLYAYGWGVPQDYDRAVYWYKLAAELGHPISAQNLGNRYWTGAGVKENKSEALKWYRIAAESKAPGFLPCSRAQYCLGLAYLQGIGGTPINKEKALEWFKIAAANGDTNSLIEIAKLEGK